MNPENALPQRLTTTQSDFDQRLQQLLAWDEASHEDIEQRVKAILHEVRQRGDEAVLGYTRQFDRLDLTQAKQLEIDSVQLNRALNQIDYKERVALEQAADRIRAFHEKQRGESWSYLDEHGNRLGQQVTALDRAGIYVPGGKAAYPSSVLMNAIPAKVAGVSEIIMCVPTPDGERNPLVLAAAVIAGVDRVFTVGGAQAVAAMAYGTDTIPAVDKIVGPGNIFVATAKRMVFGKVGIDMVAGPSEILILCDGGTDPDWIAKDLFSQAEHDELAQSILIAPDAAYLDQVEASIKKLLPAQPRAEIIATSLSNRGAMIEAKDLAQGVELINRIAPEHLELSVEDPDALLPGIRHAGAIFMGRYTAEVMGDYCAGPNHVLPTSTTARFASPLGVYDFQKRSSTIYCSPTGVNPLAELASVLARGEGLVAHAESAECRLSESDAKE